MRIVCSMCCSMCEGGLIVNNYFTHSVTIFGTPLTRLTLAVR